MQVWIAGTKLVVVGLVVAGLGLVVAGSCWCRKVVGGLGLVTTGAGRWSLVQD